LITLLGGAAVLWPLASVAQQLRRHYRIGLLSPELPPPGLLEGLEEGLRELGYVQGQNINFELRNAEGDNQRLVVLANELVRLEVDVILAVHTPAAQAAKKATTTIPIVMTRVADAVKVGLVPSLSKPTGNITGPAPAMMEQTFAKDGIDAYHGRARFRGPRSVEVGGEVLARFVLIAAGAVRTLPTSILLGRRGECNFARGNVSRDAVRDRIVVGRHPTSPSVQYSNCADILFGCNPSTQPSVGISTSGQCHKVRDRRRQCRVSCRKTRKCPFGVNSSTAQLRRSNRFNESLTQARGKFCEPGSRTMFTYGGPTLYSVIRRFGG
jgi:hypothetical protein